MILCAALVLTGCGGGQGAAPAPDPQKGDTAAPAEETGDPAGAETGEEVPEETAEVPAGDQAEASVFTTLHHQLMTTGEIFPLSTFLSLTDREIQSLFEDPKDSPDKLIRMAVNEIYARQGYAFEDQPWYHDFYSQFYWYEPGDFVREDLENGNFEEALDNIRRLEEKEAENGFAWEPAEDEPLTDDTENQALVVKAPVHPDTDVPQIYRAGRYYSGVEGEDGSSLVRCSYDMVGLTTDSAIQYPELAQALTLKSKEIEADVLADYDHFVEAAEEYPDEAQDMQFFAECSSYVNRADEKAVSVLYSYETYSGGAHPYYYSFSHAFDTATGRELKLADVVADPDSLYGRAASLLYDQVADEAIVDAGSVEELEAFLRENYPDPERDLVWSLDPDGLTLYFAPYALASFAAGELTCSIRFRDDPDFFTPAYSEETDVYVRELAPYRTYSVDLDGSGDRKDLYVGANRDEFQTVTGLVVALGDQKEEIDIYSYSLEQFLIRNGERSFLWFILTSDNDYQYTLPVDLTGGKISVQEEMSTGLARSSDYGSGGGQILITDPNAFAVGDRSQVMSTYSIARACTLGEDGKPVPTDSWWTGMPYYPLDTTAPVPAHKADPETLETGEKAEIPAGTRLTIRYTDNVSVVFLEAEDGTLYRIDLDTDEYPQTIKGKDLDDYFLRLYFAG